MSTITRLNQLVDQAEAPRSNQSGIPRILQRMAAALGIIVLSPVFLMLFLLVKAESRGPALFCQVRVGEQGRRFRFFKFRSMYMSDDPRYVDISNIDSDRDGVCKKLRHDPRITRVGRVIRKLSLDELPQLLNVVKGDMDLIGPRPALTSETDEYDQYAMERLTVRPGITGLWQVSGRADTTFDQQVELDIRYIKSKSPVQDMKILIATIPAVLFSKGAY